jgi:biofilm PGA synthesis N-glycosyltransferase PgaC
MTLLEACFWICAAGVAYAYVGYPLVLLCAAKLRPRPVNRAKVEQPPRVSIVVAAYNEAALIARRRDELVALLDVEGVEGELLIVSDGSTDRTAEAACDGAGDKVRVIELSHNVGKAEALTRAVAAASGDIVVFDDPQVGGVSGDLCLDSEAGVTSGVGLYWRYEKAVRKLESRVHSTVGATGAISAVRRSLFRPIPPRTILDDVYWPLHVVMQGYRVTHDESACAFDRLPSRAKDEFRRKVRTLSGNFQLVARAPAILLPWRNPVCFQFLSHKLLRLAVPWLLIAMLVTSLFLPGHMFRAALVAQVACYALALAGLHHSIASHARIASAAASFLVLNAAAWMSFWVWVLGRCETSWKKVLYVSPPASSPAPATAQTVCP